jgi:hypothetical protein
MCPRARCVRERISRRHRAIDHETAWCSLLNKRGRERSHSQSICLKAAPTRLNRHQNPNSLDSFEIHAQAKYVLMPCNKA